MSQILLSVFAAIMLTTALAGCGSQESRAIDWCRDNYSGYTMMECQQQMRQKYQR